MTATAEQETEGRPKRQWSEARRAAQARRVSGGGATKSDADLIAEQVLGEAVDNLKGLAAMFITPIAPHLGFAIQGVPVEGYEPGPEDWQEPNPHSWLVMPRAEMAARGILPQARRNARLLGVIHRFNVMCRNVELLEAAGGIVAAAAVDAQLVPPDVTMRLPGGAEYPILAPIIGDVLVYMAGQAPPEQAQQQPRRRRRTESADGVSEPEDPLATDGVARDVPTEEQMRRAHDLREKLRRRDEERTRQSQRQDGQTTVEGGVEGT